MAIARDASSPARFSLSGSVSVTNTESGTSGSFTPPANAWVYCSATFNSGVGASPTFSNPTNTGGGLGSWALVKSQVNASGGAVAVWRAFVNSSVATTVTVSVANGSANSVNTVDAAAWIDVWTGAATSQTGAATAGGTSTSQNFSPTVTTTASGSQVAAVGVDWNAVGTPTSTDTADAYFVSVETSGLRAYKASNSGAPGSVGVNLNSSAAGPQWSYALYEILAPTTTTTAWSSITTGFHPGASPGYGAQRFYQSPKALTTASTLTLALTGQSASFTAGTLTPSSSVAVVGQAATFAAGTLSPSSTLALTGQAATFSAGTILPALSVALTGQAGTFAAGSLTASASVAFSGASATFTAGTLTPNTSVALSGGSASFAGGNLLAAAALGLTGAAYTASAGQLTPSLDVPLQGLSASFTAGIVTVAGDVTLALTGQSATFQAGALTAQLPVQAEVPAGRRTRTIYRVTIDGQVFEFKTYEAAVSFLETAQALAAEHMQRQLPAEGPLPKPKLPEIKVNTRALRKAANETRKAIKSVYDRELMHAELRMLLELSRRREEDDTLLLLM